MESLVSDSFTCFFTVNNKLTSTSLKARGIARNFGLRGPSCDANILVKTNFYTHMHIN